MLEITRSLEISYGHNVSQQYLSERESLNSFCKCRRFHGHNANLNITFGLSKNIKDAQMVTDFNNLKNLEKILMSCLDHRFFISSLAPELKSICHLFLKKGAIDFYAENELTSDLRKIGVKDRELFEQICKDLDLDAEIQINFFSSFVVVTGETTIENMSRIVGNMTQRYLDLYLNKDKNTKFINSKGKKIEYNVVVKNVSWSETSRSKASYSF